MLLMLPHWVVSGGFIQGRVVSLFEKQELGVDIVLVIAPVSDELRIYYLGELCVVEHIIGLLRFTMKRVTSFDTRFNDRRYLSRVIFQ